jgi:hypothetical protein
VEERERERERELYQEGENALPHADRTGARFVEGMSRRSNRIVCRCSPHISYEEEDTYHTCHMRRRTLVQVMTTLLGVFSHEKRSLFELKEVSFRSTFAQKEVSFCKKIE